MPKETRADLEQLVSSLRHQIRQEEVISARSRAEFDAVKRDAIRLEKETIWLRGLVQDLMQFLRTSTTKER